MSKPLSRWRRRLRPRPRRRLCLLRRQVLRPRYRLLRLSQSRQRWLKRGKKSGRATAPETPRTTRWRSPNGRRRPGRSRNATTYRVHRGRSGLRALPSARCAELSRAALRQRGPVRICRRRGGLRGFLRVQLLITSNRFYPPNHCIDRARGFRSRRHRAAPPATQEKRIPPHQLAASFMWEAGRSMMIKRGFKKSALACPRLAPVRFAIRAMVSKLE